MCAWCVCVCVCVREREREERELVRKSIPQMSVCVCVCLCVRLCTYVCVCVHVHIHRYSRLAYLWDCHKCLHYAVWNDTIMQVYTWTEKTQLCKSVHSYFFGQQLCVQMFGLSICVDPDCTYSAQESNFLVTVHIQGAYKCIYPWIKHFFWLYSLSRCSLPLCSYQFLLLCCVLFVNTFLV